jgi:hypothetical protein
MLDHWPERDLRRFAALLHRFTEDFESANQDVMNARVAVRNATYDNRGSTN